MATRLQKYKILNTAIPYFAITKYPYDTVTADKITLTQKEIDLTYINDDKFFVTESDKRKGGYDKSENKIIMVFLYDII